MNTVIGFACAMGVNMGFNRHHHDEEESPEATDHHHAGGKMHQHHDAINKHHHDSEKDGCCNDDVMKFQRLDKNLTSNANAVINTPVLVTLPSSFFSIDIFRQPQVAYHKYIDQFFHPPPPDIRILIQSFQI